MSSNKLNIALLGYGKMGKIIESIAIERGHNISFIANSSNADFTSEDLTESNTNVAIEFSLPHFASSNINKCLDANIPVAIGTTGWYSDLDAITTKVKETAGCILPATNFSLGVNIFFEINKQLAALMKNQTQYEPLITEIHHTQKLDAPSGTAITAAEGIMSELTSKNQWVKESATSTNELVIKSIREEHVPGTHDVVYESAIDKITLSHEAKSREGFALGAVIAAEFLIGKHGIFTMKDVLNIN
ncbi:MAG: 4-hydroxy-tetrahydrodipicolinate reductase [Flavobacteriales bacterium]|jgi:4-hydroxy-tetrahydrodipicolinate reductase